MIPANKLDLTDQRFGHLLVIGEGDLDTRFDTSWECVCDCGVTKSVNTQALRRGRTLSCGCHRQRLATRHGMSESRIYKAWHQMNRRCSNPKDAGWSWYGGRGIIVCERWKKFENFYADMGDPSSGETLDRIDNDGNYEPGNCRWATLYEQSRNKRSNVMVTIGDRTQCLEDWSRESGIARDTLSARLKRGCPPDRLLDPPRQYRAQETLYWGPLPDAPDAPDAASGSR